MWVKHCNLVKADCQNSRQTQSLANSSLALPDWMLQSRQMAPIQLDSIMMLLREFLVGHTGSISGPILRSRDFRLTASSILYEKICCLWRVRILCISLCGRPQYPNVLVCEVPKMLIPCRSNQTRWLINNDIVNNVSNKHTNRYGSILTMRQQEF